MDEPRPICGPDDYGLCLETHQIINNGCKHIGYRVASPEALERIAMLRPADINPWVDR